MRMEKSFPGRCTRVGEYLCAGAACFLLTLSSPVFGLSKEATHSPVQQDVGPAPAPTPDEGDGRASSPYWRSSLWEVLPVEWLRENNPHVVVEAYQQRDWKPFFITARFEPTKGAQVLLKRLEHLEDEAIDSKPFRLETLRKHWHQLDTQRLALNHADPRYRDTLADLPDAPSFGNGDTAASRQQLPPVQYAMNSPQIPPSDAAGRQEREERYREAFKAASELDIQLASVLVRFAREMAPHLRDEVIKTLVGDMSVTDFLKRTEPASPAYRSLLSAYGRYRALAAQGGRQIGRDATKFQLGDSGNAVRELQIRLQQEGFYKGKPTGSFDAATSEAVQRFQRLHNIESDGSVGPATRERLYTPFSQKIRLIAEGLRTMRQSPTRQYDRYVLINIPQYTLEYYKGGKVVATHRVIVGKAKGKKVKMGGRMVGVNQTPTLSSAIEQIVFNPRWYVSDRIRMELNDEINADPSYLARHGYVKMSSQYPWGSPRIFQMPGPKNPLGRVKFEFPNAYAVFLHDTPKKELFRRARRDFSHGCMRVEKAEALARLLLEDDQNPSAQKIDSYLAGNSPSHVKLQQPIPIIIEYLPVSAREEGQVVFYGDPYGWFDETPARDKS